ncbi:MAG: DUF6316 family protein [Cellvibrionaceae bacterium]|nr:DUF6316 family protein [Cellvibrionaceae bacterium]
MAAQQAHRNGEQGAIPQRSNRCFQQGEYWYYCTREHIDIGPFDDRRQAEEGVAAFIEFLCRKPEFSETLKKYQTAA